MGLDCVSSEPQTVSQGSHFHMACALPRDVCRLGVGGGLEAKAWKLAMGWTRVEGQVTLSVCGNRWCRARPSETLGLNAGVPCMEVLSPGNSGYHSQGLARIPSPSTTCTLLITWPPAAWVGKLKPSN